MWDGSLLNGMCPGLVMANIYQKKKKEERKKKRDIPYKIRVLKIVFRASEREEPKPENTAQSVQESGEKEREEEEKKKKPEIKREKPRQ